MDLIREILLFAEENCDGTTDGGGSLCGIRIAVSKLPQAYHNVDDKKLVEHISLAAERKLLEVGDTGSMRIYRLTWEGYDFLDNSRSAIVWAAAKKAAGHMSFTVFVAVLARLAADHGLALLKSQSPELLELLSAGFGG